MISLWLTWFAAYKYNAKIKDPFVRQISNNITIELPDYYTYTVDNAYLTSYIVKTWVFTLDKTLTLDGFYQKDWLPLAFNYCSLLKKDAFTVDNDFDNDNIPDFKDIFPYDYSNGDYSIRKSTELDFDNDWLPNNSDKDADWNSIDDIFQWICMDREANKDQLKKIYPKKAQDLFITHKSDILKKLEDEIYTFIDTYKIEDPFTNDNHFNKFLDNLFNRLIFEDSLVVEFWDKSMIIEKKDILNWINVQQNIDTNE